MTLNLGPAAAPIAQLKGRLEDVYLNEVMDLLLHFRTQDTGIQCGEETATLTG